MALPAGASGYFSQPQLILDPQLFEGTKLLPDVRQKILDMFFDHMVHMYNDVHSFYMLWLAGSGISYQWSANRGNGDLDVLLGIDYTKFVTANPKYQYYTRTEIADEMDAMLKRHLWPRTAHTVFHPGGQAYEVTYYLNPYTENYDESIKNIHPYAAYNLTEDHWTVEPMAPNRFPVSFPVEFERKAEENRELAQRLVNRYNYLQTSLATVAPYTPQYHNWNSSKILLVQHIKTMYDDIHLGRRQAFSDMGEGYGDFYNYQWQKAKADGIVQAFNEILNKEN